MRIRSCLLFAILVGWAHKSSADVIYSVTDLGTLGGTTRGAGINSAGEVTGSSGSHAFLYSNGQMIDLGTLGASYSYGSSGLAINNAGEVVGFAQSASGATHAFLYNN